MSNLLWLIDAQMARLRTFFRRSHGEPHIDDWPALNRIVFMYRSGLRQRQRFQRR